MVAMTKPRPPKPAPKCVKVRNAACPAHGGPVYLIGPRLVCPGCERWTVSGPGGAAAARKAG